MKSRFLKRSGKSSLWARRWVRVSVYLLLALTVIPVIGLGLLALKYSQKASAVDLSKIERLEEGSKVVDAEHQELGRILVENRLLVPLEKVSPWVTKAVIATEDSRFYDHGGFDYRGMARSAVVNFQEGRIAQGGSTITQQLARHVYKLHGRTFDRKFTELFIANRLEGYLSKEKILEHYLNRIYLGSGFYGVGAAAQGYFGKDVADLEAEEAALLAGIIKSPSRYSPFVNQEEAKRVRDLSLGCLAKAGHLTEAEAKEAQRQPIEVLPKHRRDQLPDFALNAVRREVEDSVQGSKDLDGAMVVTSLQGSLLEHSAAILQDHLYEFEHSYDSLRPSSERKLEAAVVVIENSSGNVLTVVGGRNHKERPFDRALNGERPPGTALLPIVWLSTLNHDPSVLVRSFIDAPLDNQKVMIGGIEGTMAEWGAGNEEFLGTVSLATAFIHDKLNTAVRAGHLAGLDRFTQMIANTGVEVDIKPYPTSFLGQNPMTVMNVARLYQFIAIDGQRVPKATMVRSVLLENGGLPLSRPYSEPGAPGANPRAVRTVRELLVRKLKDPLYHAVIDRYGLGDEGLAGQAGSSYQTRDGWFVGMDKNITCAVWVGLTDGSPMKVANPGVELALPIWASVMAEAVNDQPQGFYQSNKLVCSQSHAIAGPACHRDGCALLSRDLFVGLDIETEVICQGPHHGTLRDPRPEAIIVEAPTPEHFVEARGPVVYGDDPYQK